MPQIKQESLLRLKDRVDLVELLGSHLELKRAGSSYKALCPFHDEKTPSFVVQRGDSHYHCFGCGAHGDAIEFLMAHLNMSFVEAVSSLAERFHVVLDYEEGAREERFPTARMHEALEEAALSFHRALVETEEGRGPLAYLEKRGISLDFVRRFRIGYAPKRGIASSFDAELRALSGLIKRGKGGDLPFFEERIMFPISNPLGKVIGFSGRKWREETFGGKYVNTPETPLFKKSKVLFGLHESRRRIAKERRVILVEGQIDALRLIDEGLNLVAAAQGTAFGEGHVETLKQLGVCQAYFAFDSDLAGQKAAFKAGNLLQKAGIEVFVAELPEGEDPDSFVRGRGVEAFTSLVKSGADYPSFLIQFYGKEYDPSSPGGKKELVAAAAAQIRTWDDEVMVHESLKKLAALMEIPEQLVGIGRVAPSRYYAKQQNSLFGGLVESDRILEMDCLRWLIACSREHPHFLRLAEENLPPDSFCDAGCRLIYEELLEEGACEDRLALMGRLEDPLARAVLENLFKKKIRKERAQEQFIETVQRILERNWLAEREKAHEKIAESSEEEQFLWLKQFNELSRNPPKVRTG